ncbi:MAG: HAD family phosphatase [Clostridia bacterium]|nr:HAD family phosphatase [Clostridia bacterium]
MKKRPDIDAIVFDLGGVLLTYDPRAYFRKLYPEPLAERIDGAIFSSPHWVEMDRSVLTMDEVLARIRKDAPDMDEWIPKALAEYYNLIQPIAENIALLPRLRAAGYRLYVLSNFGDDHFERIRARYSFLDECFDGLLISGKVQLLKPDTAIYLLLLHTFGLDAPRTLFIDDRQENVDAAQALGIRGMCYRYGPNNGLDVLF